MIYEPGNQRAYKEKEIKKTPGWSFSPSVIIHASVSVFAAIRSEVTCDVVKTEHIIIPTLTRYKSSVNAYELRAFEAKATDQKAYCQINECPTDGVDYTTEIGESPPLSAAIFSL